MSEVYNIYDEVNVTGLTQHDFTLFSSLLLKGVYVELHRDYNNKYDTKATGVFFKGSQIGWIPKAKNKEYAKFLDEHGGGSKLAKVTRNKYVEGSASDWQDTLFIKCMEVDFSSLKPDNFTQEHKVVYTSKTQPKENEMQTINEVLNKNTLAITTASFLEAGRIGNNQATKLASKHLPLMVRGYADTPFGKLVFANIAATAAGQFRPQDKRLAKLTDAMIVSAYQEVIQSFDIEKMIENMLANETIKAALSKANDE